MRILSSAACIAAFAFLPSLSHAEVSCSVTVNDTVAAAGPWFTLADLLSPGSCPGLVRTAAGLRLGQVPLPGSVRVFDGAALRGVVEKAAMLAHAAVDVAVPPRVRVLRADVRGSCEDIDPGIFPVSMPAGTECGAAGRIARSAQLVLSKPAWAASTGRWQVVARCARAVDCVPFLIQVPGAGAKSAPESEPEPETLPPRNPGTKSAPWKNVAAPSQPLPAIAEPLVQPGQRATLIWEQDGIRFAGPTTCLDRGGVGDAVRARVAPAGRVIRAIVVGAGLLRAPS